MKTVIVVQLGCIAIILMVIVLLLARIDSTISLMK